MKQILRNFNIEKEAVIDAKYVRIFFCKKKLYWEFFHKKTIEKM